jgi:hypothetical protein
MVTVKGRMHVHSGLDASVNLPKKESGAWPLTEIRLATRRDSFWQLRYGVVKPVTVV